MLTSLEAAIATGDPDAVQEAVFELSGIFQHGEQIPDEIAFEILAILKRPEMWPSPLSGHILNFFEFESRYLSPRAKDRCKAFLREWGNQFTDILSMQVVGELQIGTYLQDVPKATKRKPRHNAKNDA